MSDDRDGEDQAFVDAISEWPDINDGPTLAGFLLARIAEDEAAARQIEDGFDDFDPRAKETSSAEDRGLEWVGGDWADSYRLAIPSSRVLAECEAKRRIIGLWNLRLSDAGNPLGGETAAVYYDAIRLLALPYADHPAYRPEWRP